MKVLVVGGGGREHALVWKILQSPKVEEVFCAPGNGGIMELVDCEPVAADDIDGLSNLALSKSIDLTVVGPEAPLTAGIVDVFQERGLRIFGPSKKAAAIEGSKIFAKKLMKKYGIPTAEFDSFTGSRDVFEYLKTHSAPIVVKADGLAAGKGSIVCKTDKEAHDAVLAIMVDRAFGSAGDGVVIEECLTGEEASIFVLTDGNDFLMLPSSQDHKPLNDGDTGPNTGGMGAYAPAPIIDETLMYNISTTLIRPTIDAMRNEGIPYTGLLYAGLMITDDGPKVIEFNCRFGDPETQAVVPLIENDLVELLEATIDGTIKNYSIKTLPMYSVCVVAASGGYPGKYEKGKEIFGIDDVYLSRNKNIFHAGTTIKDGRLYTNGGRVLCVNALNTDLRWAIEEAYSLVESVDFQNIYYRTDIGKKGLARLYNIG